MAGLLSLLSDRLHGAHKLCVLGAGSLLNGDDAAGALIAQNLLKSFKSSSSVKVIVGETAPENYTGEIRRLAPDHLLLIDAADIKAPAGTVSLIDPNVIGGVSFSTHMLPLKIIVEYLCREIGCGVTILGIQPESVVYGAAMCKEVKKTVREVTRSLMKFIKRLGA